VNLLASGVRISWGAPGAGPVPSSYRLYRNTTVIRTSNTPVVVTDHPQRGIHEYRIATVDQYGNENRSEPVVIELLVSPVTSLHVLYRRGNANSLTWESNDPTVTGYNIYRNGVKQNGAPLVNRAYTDPISTGNSPVLYEITAVNAAAAESPRRVVTLFPTDVAMILNPTVLEEDQLSRVGFYDLLRFRIQNLSTSGSLELGGVRVNRTVTGTDDLVLNIPLSVTVPSGATESRDVTIPAPGTTGQQQVFQVLLEGVPDTGGSRITYEFQTVKSQAVAPSTPALMRPLDVPLAGGLTTIEVTLFNPGFAPIEVILGRNGGGDAGDLAIVVKDANGEVVSRLPFKGLGVPGIISRPDGTLFVRLQRGEILRFNVPGVLVPEFLGPMGLGATFELEVAAIYSGLGTPTSLSQSTSLGVSLFSTLVETPYFGTATTNKAAYTDSEEVFITGQAIDRASGLPAPNVPLRIGFGANGYVFYRDVTSDANGDYELAYTPSVGFAGTLHLWAAHPDVVDQLNQVTIEYRRIYMMPANGNIVMSKNDTLDFSLRVVNPGDLPLSDLQISAQVMTMVGGVPVPTNKIRFERLGDPGFHLNPYQARDVAFRAIADLDAPDDAIARVSLVSAEGASAVFEGVMALRPAVPVLSFVRPAVGYVDLSVNRGDLNSTRVTLENRGLRAMEGVRILPPAGLGWMDLNLPRNGAGEIVLPDVPVGGSLSFDVVYAPPAGTPLGLYSDFLLIRGSNLQSDFRVNLFAQVTSSQVGSLKFYVDNIFAEPVPNARVRLRNPNLREDLGPFTTDSNGEVIIDNLQEGPWSYQITASGHTSASGTADVMPGQVTLATHRLSKSLVTVEFSVTPKPFTDRYEITIEQTFETRVPFPVLIMDPPSFTFRDLPEVASGTVMVNVTNKGLASLWDCFIRGEFTSWGSFIPLIRYIPELQPGQTVEVPFRWTYDNRVGASQVGTVNSSESPGLGGLNPETADRAGRIGEALTNTVGLGIDPFSSPTAFCAAAFFTPSLPDPVGLAAFAQAAACCPDGAAALTAATALWIGFATYSFITSGLSTLAMFIGCVLGGNFGFAFSGGGGPGGGGGGPPSGGGALGPGGPICFAADTEITLSDGTKKRIQEIVAGDVLKSATLPGYEGTVSHVFAREDVSVFRVDVEPLLPQVGQTETITLSVTSDHDLWSDENGWTQVANLKVGECLHHESGTLYRVVGLVPDEEAKTVYSIQLTGDSAYFADGILARHLCGNQKAGLRLISGTGDTSTTTTTTTDGAAAAPPDPAPTPAAGASVSTPSTSEP
jgi:hypothetical protein